MGFPVIVYPVLTECMWRCPRGSVWFYLVLLISVWCTVHGIDVRELSTCHLISWTWRQQLIWTGRKWQCLCNKHLCRYPLSRCFYSCGPRSRSSIAGSVLSWFPQSCEVQSPLVHAGAQLPPLPVGSRCHPSTDCVEIWGGGGGVQGDGSLIST